MLLLILGRLLSRVLLRGMLLLPWILLRWELTLAELAGLLLLGIVALRRLLSSWDHGRCTSLTWWHLMLAWKTLVTVDRRLTTWDSSLWRWNVTKSGNQVILFKLSADLEVVYTIKTKIGSEF